MVENQGSFLVKMAMLLLYLKLLNPNRGLLLLCKGSFANRF